MARFIIHGGRKLRGTVRISGSKNAALPLLAATILTDRAVVLQNVPKIADVEVSLQLLRSIGKTVERRGNTVTVSEPRALTAKTVGKLSDDLTCAMRASILFLGPMVARFGRCEMGFPGGCVLGKRSIDTHVKALRALGAKITVKNDRILATAGGTGRGGGGRAARAGNGEGGAFLRGAHIVLGEFSVTATENALMAAALAHGVTHIQMAAAEPHVKNLCDALQKMGVRVSGIGTHELVVRRRRRGALRGTKAKVRLRVVPDYLEAGVFAIAALLTGGKIILQGVNPDDLYVFWDVLERMGAKLAFAKNSVTVAAGPRLRAIERVQTAIHPGFPTDLQAPMTVLLTQLKGETVVHEALFEDRFRYISELRKMGARIQVLDAHRIRVRGPVKLRGKKIQSLDIRAGAAMILAGLAASGKTEVTNINYIDRGYENLEMKLQKLGAGIERL